MCLKSVFIACFLLLGFGSWAQTQEVREIPLDSLLMGGLPVQVKRLTLRQPSIELPFEDKTHTFAQSSNRAGWTSDFDEKAFLEVVRWEIVGAASDSIRMHVHIARRSHKNGAQKGWQDTIFDYTLPRSAVLGGVPLYEDRQKARRRRAVNATLAGLIIGVIVWLSL